MERGLAGGLDYKMTFPQQQGMMAAPEVVAQEPTYEAMDFPEQVLANRRDKVQNLFRQVGRLRTFAQEMAKQGIDVFQPDFSSENGGDLYNAMLEMDANIRYAANALKQEALAEQQLRPYVAQDKIRMNQGVDPNSELAYSDPRNFYSTDLTPGAARTNESLAQQTHSLADQNRANQLLTLESQKIDQQVSQGLISRERGEFLKAQLVPNAYKTPVFAPRDNDGKKYDYQIALLRKYTNLKNGVWEPGSFSKVTEGGKVYLKNEDGKGDLLGKYESGVDSNGNPVLKDKIVSHWLKDPKTGKVYVKFTDPNIPIEEVSNQPGDAITRNFVSNNQKYGSVDKIMEAATATGLVNEKGSSIDEYLMPQNYQDIQSQIRNTGLEAANRIDTAVTNLKKQLQGLKDPTFGNNWIDYTLPDGRIAQVAKHRGRKSYYIRNYEDLGFQKEQKNLSEDEAFNLLDSEFKYFSKFMEPAEETQKLTQRQQSAIEAFSKKFGREPNPTERQKLLEKYK